ncbi:HSP20-like chaperone [Xylariaceae sp. FL1651]|nr:HSP20-like chaperone [Xylariaceae sp. FL1651]
MENHNNNHNNPQAPFWDFVRSFEPNGQQRPGVGVDHSNNGPQFPEGFPFNAAGFGPWGNPWAGAWAGPWGRRGRHGPFGHRHHYGRHDSGDEDSRPEETAAETETMRDNPEEGGDHPPPPPHEGPTHSHPHPHPHHHHGPPPAFGPQRRRGGRCGRGGRHAPPPAYSGPFDMRPLMHAFSTHPFAQVIRDYVDQSRAGATGTSPQQQQEGQAPAQQDGVFVPPVDIFSTEKAYVLHVALPGASKEDIGVSWDGDKVNIAGVVYRPGNEEFLSTLALSERKVGMFERSIKLPPVGSDDGEDVDGYGITAKMENGILVVTVPKVEKEWTEIHKVDIE